jgi:hypothetical protein
LGPRLITPSNKSGNRDRRNGVHCALMGHAQQPPCCGAGTAPRSLRPPACQTEPQSARRQRRSAPG